MRPVQVWHAIATRGRPLALLACCLALAAPEPLSARSKSKFVSSPEFKDLAREFNGHRYSKTRAALIRRGYRPLRFAHPRDSDNDQCGDGFCKRFPESLNCSQGETVCDFFWRSPARRLVEISTVNEGDPTVVRFMTLDPSDMNWLRQRGYPAALTAPPTVEEKLYWRFRGQAYDKVRPRLVRLGFKPVPMAHPSSLHENFCADGLCRRYPELLNCASPDCDFMWRSPGGQLLDVVTSQSRPQVMTDVREADVPDGILLPLLRMHGYRPRNTAFFDDMQGH